MTMYKDLDPKADIEDKTCIQKKRKGNYNIEDCVDSNIRRLYYEEQRKTNCSSQFKKWQHENN